MGSLGVVYLATGGGQQQRLLAISREQLRLRHPELEQHVVSDEELRAESGEQRVESRRRVERRMGRDGGCRGGGSGEAAWERVGDASERGGGVR
jgi:hypothetical protein